MFGIAVPENIKAAPIIYGIKVCLYSDFSSTLPSKYFIPIPINTKTATTAPID